MSGPAVIGAADRLSKLRAMSVAEVAERIRYRAVLDLERRQHKRGRLGTRPADLGRVLVAALQGHDWKATLLSARRNRSFFFSSTRSRDVMRRLFESRYGPELAETRRHAAAARAHRFEFFGREFAYGEQIDWQVDPVTGRRWPELFHADVPVHGGDVGFGDVKYVWELNRHQFLIDLAKAWFLDGSREDLEAVQRLVRSWIAGNPYATGVNWSCALEPAFRALSWLWGYHLTVDALDDECHVEWLAALHEHGRFIARHLERYSSPYNHLIGEAATLYMLANAFPEFRAAPAWRTTARRVLEGRLHEQFYPDGGSVEQSTFYHHATTGFYLLAGLTARAAGDDLSPAVWKAIERALDFSAALIQPDGRAPEIGGADDGKPIRMQHLPFWDFRPYQAVGAVLFERADFKTIAGRFHEDALWLLGPEGLNRFDALGRQTPSTAATVLAKSGYAVSRSEWSSRADYLCLDVGEQAIGMRTDAVPNSMHGHADCLSIVVWLDGKRVLVDSGLFAYNCGGEWEAHFRETAAHNTARIDGRDQARHIRKMAWSHSYRATLEGQFADGRQSWTIGSHDGYARGADGVTHRRVAWLRPDGYVLVCDEFAGTGDHEIEVNYQFAPGELRLNGDGYARFDAAADIAWVGTGSWEADTRCGGPGPQDGWICPSLGVRQAAPRLTLRGRTSAPRTTLLTVLATPGTRRRRVSRIQVDTVSTLMAIDIDATTDVVAAAGIASTGPLTSDALLAVCRVTGAGVVDTVRAGGNRIDVDAAALGKLTESRPVCPN